MRKGCREGERQGGREVEPKMEEEQEGRRKNVCTVCICVRVDGGRERRDG